MPTGPQFDNRRVAAALIDLLIPLTAAILARAAGLAFTRGLVLVGIGWTLYYFFALESGDGQTLGKRAMKLRVVSADGGPASMEQIAKRTVVRVLDGHLVGLIVMLATGDRRVRLGDIVAGTVVTDAEGSAVASEAPSAPVREAKPSRLKRPLRMPARSLRMPALKRATFTKPGFRNPFASGKPAFLTRSIAMPSLRRRSRPEVSLNGARSVSVDEPDPRPRSQEPPADRAPDAPRDALPPHVEPFEPFAEPVAGAVPYEDYEPQVEFDRPDVEVELDASEPWVEDDEPDPLADLGNREPVVEFDEPDPEPPVPALPEDEAPGGAHRDPPPAPPEREDAEPEMTIKPIETVSAIDLVMQDAEDQHRPGR